MTSVNTNSTAMLILNAMNMTSNETAASQKRVSTGLRVADSRDDAAAFATAQQMRSDVSSLQSVNRQLEQTRSVVSNTSAAVTEISKVFEDAKKAVTQLADPGVTGDKLLPHIEAYNTARLRIAEILNSSTGPGNISLLGRSSIAGNAAPTTAAVTGGPLTVNSDIDGDSLTILGTGLVDVDGAGTAPLGHQFDLRSATGMTKAMWAEYLNGPGGTADVPRSMSQIEGAINSAASRYAAGDRAITSTQTLNNAKAESLEKALGSLVDADLAKESTRLQSLQIRQQLGASALSSANGSAQFLTNLFRG